jgi:hypothetical protein
MAVGATHIELWVVGTVMVGVLVLLGFMFRDAMAIQSRNGKKVRGEKLL